MISAILLAAGSSKRMGEKNKLLLKVGEYQVLQKSLNALLNSELDEIVLVTGFENNLVSQSVSNRDQITIVKNELHNNGMTSSIQSGVKAASGEASAYMICLGDMPMLTSTDINALVAKWNSEMDTKHKILRPVHNERFGNPVIFSSTYKQAILDHDAPEGCKEIIASNKNQVITCEMTNDHIFRDIDTPEDYQQLL